METLTSNKVSPSTNLTKNNKLVIRLNKSNTSLNSHNMTTSNNKKPSKSTLPNLNQSPRRSPRNSFNGMSQNNHNNISPPTKIKKIKLMNEYQKDRIDQVKNKLKEKNKSKNKSKDKPKNKDSDKNSKLQIKQQAENLVQTIKLEQPDRHQQLHPQFQQLQQNQCHSNQHQHNQNLNQHVLRQSSHSCQSNNPIPNQNQNQVINQQISSKSAENYNKLLIIQSKLHHLLKNNLFYNLLSSNCITLFLKYVDEILEFKINKLGMDRFESRHLFDIEFILKRYHECLTYLTIVFYKFESVDMAAGSSVQQSNQIKLECPDSHSYLSSRNTTRPTTPMNFDHNLVSLPNNNTSNCNSLCHTPQHSAITTQYSNNSMNTNLLRSNSNYEVSAYNLNQNQNPNNTHLNMSYYNNNHNQSMNERPSPCGSKVMTDGHSPMSNITQINCQLDNDKYIEYGIVENFLVGLVQIILNIYPEESTSIFNSCIVNDSFLTKLQDIDLIIELETNFNLMKDTNQFNNLIIPSFDNSYFLEQQYKHISNKQMQINSNQTRTTINSYKWPDEIFQFVQLPVNFIQYNANNFSSELPPSGAVTPFPSHEEEIPHKKIKLSEPEEISCSEFYEKAERGESPTIAQAIEELATPSLDDPEFLIDPTILDHEDFSSSDMQDLLNSMEICASDPNSLDQIETENLQEVIDINELKDILNIKSELIEPVVDPNPQNDDMTDNIDTILQTNLINHQERERDLDNRSISGDSGTVESNSFNNSPIYKSQFLNLTQNVNPTNFVKQEPKNMDKIVSSRDDNNTTQHPNSNKNNLKPIQVKKEYQDTKLGQIIKQVSKIESVNVLTKVDSPLKKYKTNINLKPVPLLSKQSSTTSTVSSADGSKVVRAINLSNIKFNKINNNLKKQVTAVKIGTGSNAKIIKLASVKPLLQKVQKVNAAKVTKLGKKDNDLEEFELEINNSGNLVRSKPVISIMSDSDSDMEIFLGHTAKKLGLDKQTRKYTRRKPLKKKDSKNAKRKADGSLVEEEEEIPALELGQNFPKESNHEFPEGSIKILSELLRPTNKSDSPDWTLKDLISLLVLCKLYGAGDFKMIHDLNIPRLKRFSRKEIKSKFVNLEKKNIVLRDINDKSRFLINHDILSKVVTINVDLQKTYFSDNYVEVFKRDSKYINFLN